MVQKTSLRRVLYGRSLWYVTVCLFVIFGLLLNTFFGSVPKTAEAATSSTMNFQARLLSSSGALVPDGYYNVQFKLYDAATVGNNVWTETYHQTNRVRVVNGYLSVNLGSLTAFGSINWDQEHWLTMNVGGTTNTPTPTWDGEMTPRLKLTAVPYAFQAGQLTKQSGSNRGVLQFNNLTANRTINLPDESGTLCIQNSANCGFLTGVPGNYIQNGTAPQTADFNITGQGTVGGTMTANLFQGSGASLTSLNASNISSGTLNDARLSSNVMLLTGNQTVTGIKTFDNTVNISGSNKLIFGGDVELYRVAANVLQLHNSNLRSQRSNAADSAYSARVSGDSVSRLMIRADGGMSWGDGTNPRDVSLQRQASGYLRLGGNFEVTGTYLGLLNSNATIAFGSGGDVNLYRGGSNLLQTDDAFNVVGALTQNGNAVCTVAGNCAGLGGNGDILQGGNSFGPGGMTIGTNDEYDLNLETNGISRVTVSSTNGNVHVHTGVLNVVSGSIQTNSVSRISNAGVLQNVTANANILTSGTLDDARLSSNVMLLTGNQTVTGIKTFNNTVNISGSNQVVLGGDANLYRSAANVLKTDDSLHIAGSSGLNGPGGSTVGLYLSDNQIGVRRSASNQGVFIADVQGDAQARFVITAAGTILWGDGTNARDTNLYRSAANQLQTDDAFNVVGALTQGGSAVCTVAGNCAGVGGNGDILQGGNSFGTAMAIGTNDNYNLDFRTNNAVRMTLTTTGQLQLPTTGINGGLVIGGDTNLYRSSAGVLKTNSNFTVERSSDSVAALTTLVSGDTYTRIYVTAKGDIAWGDGANPHDTNLYRSAANTLRTDDNFSVGGTITGNGSGLTSLNASNISSGTLNDARLSSNVMLLSGNQTVTGVKTFNATLNMQGSNAITLGSDVSLSRTAANVLGLATGDSFNLISGNLQFGGTTVIDSSRVLQNVTANASIITAGTLNDARLSSNVALLNATANFTGALQQNGNAVCTVAGNCAGVGGTGDILQGGNSFTAAMTIGTNDNYALNFETNGTTRMTISNAGAVSTTGNLSVGGTLSGNGSGLTSLNGSNISSGTVANTRLVGSGALTVTAGNGLTGGGSVALGASTSLAIGAGDGITVNTSSVAVDSSVCRTSGNCAGVGGTGDILQGGNSFTAAMTIGTNDNYALNFETNGTTRMTIANTGAISTTGNLSVGGTLSGNGSGLTTLNASNLSSGTIASGRVAGSYTGITGVGALNAGSITSGFGNINIGSSTFTGNGSGLTSLNGTNITTGTVADARLSSNVMLLDNAQTITGIKTFDNTVNISGSNQIVLGGDTNLYRSAANTLTTDDNLRVLGRTTQFSNENPVYRWRFGGGTDLNWKTIADISIGTGTYKGASFRVDITDAGSLHGATADIAPMTFFVSAHRSGPVQDDADTGSVSGPVADYVRLVKTALGEYELQVRQPVNYRNILVQAQKLSTDNITLVYADNPVNGSTSGDIYTASHNGWTQHFANINVNGNLQTGGTTRLTSAGVLQNVSMDAAQLTGTINDARLSSNVARLNAAANFTAGLQVSGNNVCHAGNNCGFASASNTILQGGNSFTAAMTIGTNDNYALNFETNGTTRMTISNAGAVSTTGDLSVGGTLSGNGSGLTSLNATNISSGTLSDARLSTNVMQLNNNQIVTGIKTFNNTVNIQGSNTLTLGSDVSLSRTGANVLGLASGDSFNIISGNLQFGGTTVIDSSRVLQNVTANASIITAGTLNDARLSSNVMLLDNAQTITGIKTFNNTVNISGSNQIILGGDTNLYRSAANVLRTDDTFSASGALIQGGSAALVIDATGAGNTVMRFRDDGVETAAIYTLNGENTLRIRSEGKTMITGGGATGNHLTVDTNGNVGIGTNSPSSLLHLGKDGGTSAQGITFGASADTNLYRSGANQLQTDDSFNVLGTLSQNGNAVCHVGNNCNYAAASGSSSYIQNGTSPQTANFNITGSGAVGGNFAVGVSSPTVINASSAMFAGIVPKMEILTGSSTGLYEEMVTIRHNAHSETAGTRRIGMILKMSSENSTGESSKMGGMVLESGSNYANSPSLFLVTSNEKRLQVTYSGNINIVSGDLQTNGTTRLTNAGVLQNVTANASIITAGTLNDARLSSNVALKNAAANFTGGLQVSGNNVCHAGNNCSYAPASGSSNYIHLQASTPGTAQTGHINITGTAIAGTFSGSGSGLTSLNASNLSSGTVNTARISGSYTGITGVGTLTAGSIGSGFGNINIGTNTFTGNGSGLTALNASNISSGTLNDGRLSSNVALLNRNAQVFTGNEQVFRNASNSSNGFRIQNTAGTDIFRVSTSSSSIYLNGYTVVDGWLDANNGFSSYGYTEIIDNSIGIYRSNFNNTAIFTQRTGDSGFPFTILIDGSMEWGDGTNSSDTNLYRSAANTLRTDNNLSVGGTISGNGSGLTTLNASNISSGTLNDARLSTNVMQLNNNQIITGIKTFNNTVNMQGSNAITLGGDVSISRTGANVLGLATGDSFNIVSGNLQFGGTTVIDSSRVLQNVTANASIITAGTLADARLSSNVALLNRNSQTITGNNQTFRNASNSTTAFVIQNASSTTLFAADTTNSRIVVGNDSGTVSLRVGGGTNRIETNGDNQLRLYGSARNAKKITLTPEYAGAVLNGTGIGNMTAGFDIGNYKNYYVWTSSETSAQTYSVVVQVPVPSDWDAWGSSPAVSIDMWSSNTSKANGTVTIVGSDGVIDINNSSMTPGSANTWTTKTISSLNASRYSADGVMTVIINMSAQDAETFRIGKITLDYLSKF